MHDVRRVPTGIDLMEKEKREERRAIAESYAANQVEARQEKAIAKLNENVTNNNIHLTELQQIQSAREESESGEWRLRVEDDEVMREGTLNTFMRSMTGKKQFGKSERKCHFCKRKGHCRASCMWRRSKRR